MELEVYEEPMVSEDWLEVTKYNEYGKAVYENNKQIRKIKVVLPYSDYLTMQRLILRVGDIMLSIGSLVVKYLNKTLQLCNIYNDGEDCTIIIDSKLFGLNYFINDGIWYDKNTIHFDTGFALEIKKNIYVKEIETDIKSKTPYMSIYTSMQVEEKVYNFFFGGKTVLLGIFIETYEHAYNLENNETEIRVTVINDCNSNNKKYEKEAKLVYANLYFLQLNDLSVTEIFQKQKYKNYAFEEDYKNRCISIGCDMKIRYCSVVYLCL